MNAAILVGFSDHLDSETNETEIKNNIEGLELVLKNSGKYDEILVLQDKITAVEAKKQISIVIEKLKSSNVDELFFYFSGYGYYKSNEFHYICKDFTKNKLKQTSLLNNELDDIFRSVSPNLIVKIVDVYQSTNNHFKHSEKFKKYIENTTKKHDDCYCLFSLLKNQYSSQNRDVSVFIDSIFKAVNNSNKEQISYQEIIDYLSNYFTSHEGKKEFFVPQGNFTDIFIDNIEKIKESLNNFLSNFKNKISNSENEEKNDFIGIIKEKSQKYLNKNEALDKLNELNNYLENFKIENSLNELYFSEIIKSSYFYQIPDSDKLYTWLEKNKEVFFININHKYKEYQEEENPKENDKADFFVKINDENEILSEQRRVITGFDIPVKAPFKVAKLNLIPKFENLNKYSLYLLYIFNKKDFVLFSNKAKYKENYWGEWHLEKTSGWNKEFYFFKEIAVIQKAIKENINNFINEVEIALKRDI